MKIIEKAINTISPYDLNNKVHDEEQIIRLVNSIKEFGFTQPVVIDKNGVIIIGHGRFEAAKRLKMQKIPCVVMEDLTEDQIKKLRILDNKLNESEWDLGNLKFEIEGLENFNIGDLNIGKFDLFPELETHEFNGDEYSDVSFKAKNKEISEDDLGEFEHTCPKCGFGFND